MSSKTRLQSAVDATISGHISGRKAAKSFGVSQTTLRRHIKNSSISSKGRPNKFTVQEELAIEDLLLSCADLGVPLSKTHLKEVLHAMSIEKGLAKKSFSETWHTKFLKRHPRLSERISQATDRRKARQWTMDLCDEYIATCDKLSREGYFEDPNCIWNLDESGFALGGRYSKVYAEKGVTEVASFYDGDDRTQLTVLACGNAAGKVLRPLVLYDGKVELASRVEGTEDKFLVTTNKSGWMDNKVFTAYITEELIPAMPEGKNLITLDGHTSHLHNISFVKACLASNRQIQILVFPAGQTGKLQPWDVSAYGPVKKRWRRHLSELHLNIDGLEPLTRNTFPAHLKMLWSTLNLETSLRSGFEKTGIFPYNPAVIRATVQHVAKSQVPARTLKSSSVFDEEQILRGSLSRLGMSPLEVDQSIVAIEKRLSGRSAGYDIAECMHKRLNSMAPEKKRRLKDVRLSTEAGKLWSSSSVLAALEEREAELAKKNDKKNAKIASKNKPAKTIVKSKSANKLEISQPSKPGVFVSFLC